MFDGSVFPTPSEMAQFQADAEDGMRDTCTVRRENGTTRDPETGLDVTAYDTIHAGKCKVQAASSLASSPQDIGGGVLTLSTRYVHLPISAPAVKVDDLIDIDTSLDPQLVGTTFRVTSPFGKTYATARRLEVVSV